MRWHLPVAVLHIVTGRGKITHALNFPRADGIATGFTVAGNQGPGGYWPTEKYCSTKAPGESLEAYLAKLFGKK